MHAFLGSVKTERTFLRHLLHLSVGVDREALEGLAARYGNIALSFKVFHRPCHNYLSTIFDSRHFEHTFMLEVHK